MATIITKEVAEKMSVGTVLHHVSEVGSDGMPVRCRVNGKCKVWKTRPEEFQLPVKHGLNNCFYITNRNASMWRVPD